MMMLEPIIFDNHQVAITDIYITGDLVFLVILLGKGLSLEQYLKCKLYPKVWLEYEHKIGEDWTINTLRLIAEYDSIGSA